MFCVFFKKEFNPNYYTTESIIYKKELPWIGISVEGCENTGCAESENNAD